MFEKNNKNNFYTVNEGRSVRPSFRETLQEVRKKVEIECFEKTDMSQANELCLILTEVLMLNPENEIRIGGVMLSVGMVQEVYGQIEHEHVELVIGNFNKVSYEVKNKKSYLRTALYNSVFEIESHWTNQFHVDFDE